MVTIPSVDKFGRSKKYYSDFQKAIKRRQAAAARKRNGRSSSRAITTPIQAAEQREELFLESERKIAQHAYETGKLTLKQANQRLSKSFSVIQKKVDDQLLRDVRKHIISPTDIKRDKFGIRISSVQEELRRIDRGGTSINQFDRKITSGVRIGRKLTNSEKVKLLKTTDLSIQQLDRSVAIVRNGELMIETPGVSKKLPMPEIERGKRVKTFVTAAEKAKGWLTKEQERALTSKAKTSLGKKIALNYKPFGKVTSKVIKKNPDLIGKIVDRSKMTDKTIKELRVMGLEISKTLIDGAVFGKDAVKFLTINNPAWNKPNRDMISKGIIKYSPEVWNWGKKFVTDKQTRKIAGAATVAIAADSLNYVRLSPGRALGKVGGEFILFVAMTEGWKAFKVVDKKMTHGLVKVGNKWIKQSKLLNAIVRKGGAKFKSMKVIGNKLFVSTKKIARKPIKAISKRILNKKIKTAIRLQEKRLGRKLTTLQKKSIAAKIKKSLLKPKLTLKEKESLRRAIALQERKIKGVKVGKKEFKSYQAAEQEFNKMKRLRQFGQKIKSKGGAGVSQKLHPKSISTTERDLMRIYKQVPSGLKVKAKKLSVTTLSQKFVTDVPIIKRFGTIKKGVWRVVFKQKTFYQNTVSFSMFGKTGKGLGTFSYNTLSSRKIQSFRSIENALKYGSGKSITLSKQVGNNFVKSFVFKSRGSKITQTQFLSKIKLVKKGIITDVDIVTKKVTGVAVSKKTIKKQLILIDRHF